MKFGCCLSAGSFVPQVREGDAAIAGGDGITRSLEVVKEAGFDFVELTVRSVMNPPGGDLDALAAALQRSGLSPMAFNSFIPTDIRITGPDVDWERLNEYVAEACARVARLGGELIVFGSGGARSYPADWPAAHGWEQLVRFLGMTAEAAGRHGLSIAIEPLNKLEDNAVNSVSQGIQLAEAVGREQIRTLADLYHMEMEHEPYEVVRRYGAQLIHVHVADTGRRAPGTGDWDYAGFFQELIGGGYGGAVSIECKWESFADQAEAACRVLREAWRRAEERVD